MMPDEQVGGVISVDKEAFQVVFSVGHSNHPLSVFLNLLKKNDIQVIVDVRSHPYSKYSPHFASPSLKEALVRSGIRYVYMGDVLGGHPDGEEFYDAEGHVLYSRVAASPVFLAGIDRLERGIQEYRVAVMCSEESPLECHRRLLIGRVLAGRGIRMMHVRGSGILQAEDELVSQETPEFAQGQLTFFNEQEEDTWRSSRSVSPGNRRPSFSEP